MRHLLVLALSASLLIASRACADEIDQFSPGSPEERAQIARIFELVAGKPTAGDPKPVTEQKNEALQHFLVQFPGAKFAMNAAAVLTVSLKKAGQLDRLPVIARAVLGKSPDKERVEMAMLLARNNAALTRDPKAALALADELAQSKSADIAWRGCVGGAQVLDLTGDPKAALERLDKRGEKDLTPAQQIERDFAAGTFANNRSGPASGDETTKAEERALDCLQRVAVACEKDGAANAEYAPAFVGLAHVWMARGESKLAGEAYARVLKLYPGTNEAQEAELIAPQLALIGSPAPAFEGPGLDGKPWSSKELAGKVAIVDFWATTCVPCLQEAPHVVKLVHEQQGRKRPLAIVSISLDMPGRKDAIEKFVQKSGIDWPQVYEGKGWQSEIAPRWKVTAMPSIFLVDAKGVVKRCALQGRELDEAVEAELARAEGK